MLDPIRKNAQSWGIKVAFAVIILVFILGFGFSSKSGPGAVLATVGDDAILIKDFEVARMNQIEALRQQNPNITADDLTRMKFKEQVMWQMVNALLIEQEAGRLGVAVSPAEVFKTISRLPAFRGEGGAFDRTLYERVLATQGLTPAKFETDMRRDMLLAKMQKYVSVPADVTEAEARGVFDFAREELKVNYLPFAWEELARSLNATDEQIQAFYEQNAAQFSLPPRVAINYIRFTPAELAKTVAVSPEEIKAFYDQNGERYFFQTEEVKARHILLTLAENAPEAEVKKATDTLLEIAARVKKGESFAELARKYSQGPTSVNGGDLGWFTKGQMVPAFEEAAFALKPGKVSEPVRTPFGLHLIMLEDRHDARLKALDEVTDEIRTMIAEEKATESLNDTLDVAVEHVVAGESLDAAAKAVGLEVRESQLFNRDQAASLIGLETKSVDVLFATPEGTTLDTPLSVNKGYIIATVAKSLPTVVQPLEDVRGLVEERVRRTQGMDMAKATAEATLAQINASGLPEALAATLKTSDAFGRQGFIPGLGMNPALVSAAYAAKPGEWLPAAYQTGTGYALAQLAERIAPAGDRWNEEKDFWVANLTQSKQRNLFAAYMQNLREKAKVAILAPEVLK
ncbi:MAG: SurA N-terminal domain-containing protein [Desulfovibrionaceae bacterium]